MKNSVYFGRKGRTASANRFPGVSPKRFSKKVLTAFTLAAITLSSGCVTNSSGASGSLAQRAKGKVSIYRDDWGVPYIFAAREEDGYFGVGYSLAEDRPERYYQLVLWGTGTWSAARGDEITPLGIPASVLDDWAARWRHVDESKAAFERLDPQVRKNYESFARGFEQYFSDHPEKKPDWAPTLEPWHAVAVLRGVMWPFSMISDGSADCARGGIRVSQSTDAEIANRVRLASNEWVVQPKKTTGGKTMLLSDPHGPIDGGLIFNEFNIRAGRVHASVYGIGPIPILGNTDALAWAATTGAPDVSDCYAIKVDPNKPLRYKFDNEWREIGVQSASIAVKNGPPIKKDYEYIIQNGVFSPVVARENDTAYVISTPYMHEASSGIEEFERFLRAENVDAAFAAMTDPKIFGQNYMFADRRGNALYVRAGRTPIRPEGFDWTQPVDGNSSKSSWIGIHKARDLVWALNPAQGYMKNTNEAPDQLTVTASPIKAPDYPPYIYNDPGFTTSRSARLGTLLDSARKFTLEDAMSVAFDETLPYTPRWRSALNLAAAALPETVASFSTDERKIYESIRNFDGVMDQSSIAAARYQAWRDAVGTALDLKTAREIKGEDPKEPLHEIPAAAAEILLSSVRSAAADLKTHFGGVDAVYGDIWRIGRGEADWPIGSGTICLDARGRGCEETLRAFSVRGPVGDDGRRRPQYGGRMMRLVVFGDDVESYAAFNYGQSDDPASPHYDDQARGLFSAGKMRRIYKSEFELKKAGAEHHVLWVDRN